MIQRKQVQVRRLLRASILAQDRDGSGSVTRRFFPDGTVGREDRSAVHVGRETLRFIDERHDELHALRGTRAAGELVPRRQRAMAHIVRRTAAERGRHGRRRVGQGRKSAGTDEGRQTAGAAVVGLAAHGDRGLRGVELGQIAPGLGAGQ